MKISLGAKMLIMPSPVFIVGTYGYSGQPNVATGAWGGGCCSEPPCIAISLRKATYTYGNIILRKAFTVSPATEDYVREADYFGIAAGRDIDKFHNTSLTPQKGTFVDAPYAAELPLVFECKLLHTIEIGLHTQFIGEILDTKTDERILGKNSLPDITKLRPVAYAPQVRSYHSIGDILGTAFSIGKIFRK